MSSTDGGPAFPFGVRVEEKTKFVGCYPGEREGTEVTQENNPGMSLRDYFAAHSEGLSESARAAELGAAYPEAGPCPDWKTDPVATSLWWLRVEALARYRAADALIWARSFVGKPATKDEQRDEAAGRG